MVASVAVLSGDVGQVDRVRRLCTVAGVELDVCADVADLAARWRDAAAVVVDETLAIELLGLQPPRRPGVVLLATHADHLEVWQAAARLGAEQVAVLPGDEQTLIDCLAAAAEPGGGAGVMVGVTAGSGGSGASTLAVALAMTAAADGPAALVDLDPCGGGLDLPLGLEHTRGARWPELAAARGFVAGPALDELLVRDGALRLLSAARCGEWPAPDAVTAVLAAMRRLAPTVVLDLPRATATEPAGRCDVLLLVVVAEVRAVAAAVSSLELLRRRCRDVRLVVRTPPRARLRSSDVAAALQLPVAATVPTDASVPAAADRGRLADAARRGELGAAARTLLAALPGPAHG